MSNQDNYKETEEMALDFLEQWLSGNGSTAAAQLPAEAPRSLDPSLRAIERLVAQHKELFRRHARSSE